MINWSDDNDNRFNGDVRWSMLELDRKKVSTRAGIQAAAVDNSFAFVVRWRLGGPSSSSPAEAESLIS